MIYECTQPESGLTIVKFSKALLKQMSIEMCTQPVATPESMRSKIKLDGKEANIICNLGFFSTGDGSSIWNLLSNGQYYANNGNTWDGLGITKDGEVKLGKLSDGNNWDDFCNAYPLLIKDGVDVVTNIAKEIDYSANRTMIGWTKEQNTFFVFSMDGSCKGNFSKCRKKVRSYIPDVDVLMNFDGGGSVYLSVDGVRKSQAGYVRPVDSILAIWLKDKEEVETPEDTKKTGYRCQFGAFKSPANAANFLEQVQKIKSDVLDYSKAFITRDNDLYKVQVGFFSKKENAERVKADLASKGYDCYIKYVEL